MDSNIEDWKNTYSEIIRKRDEENVRLRAIQGRQFFADDGANHLIQCVAQVMSCRVLTPGLRPTKWASLEPQEIRILDVHRIVSGVDGKRSVNPLAAINGRLRKMVEYAPETNCVGVAKQRKARGVEHDGDGGVVFLYRSQTPLR